MLLLAKHGDTLPAEAMVIDRKTLNRPDRWVGVMRRKFVRHDGDVVKEMEFSVTSGRCH
jgi:hypothetical protein